MMFLCSSKITGKVKILSIVISALLFMIYAADSAAAKTSTLKIEKTPDKQVYLKETVFTTIENKSESKKNKKNSETESGNVIINNYYSYPPNARETVYVMRPVYPARYNTGGYSFGINYAGGKYNVNAGAYNYGGHGYDFSTGGKKYYVTPWTPLPPMPPPPAQNGAQTQPSAQQTN